MVTEDKLEVEEVIRDEDGRVWLVTIGYRPFRMRFGKKNGRTSLLSFERSDGGTLDEPDWVPSQYFNPAIGVARGIFSSSRKEEKKKEKALQLQARLFH